MDAMQSTILPTLRYRNAPAAIDWLCSVLGFTRHQVYEGPDNTIAHAQLTLGGGMIMLGTARDDKYGRGFKCPCELDGIETGSRYVIVPDADAVHARAAAANAHIIGDMQDTEYGSREFSVKDPEGHSWTIGTYNPWAEATH